ncbi:MAG: Rieske 2Fe-2S domain-containing protein [Burkholderiales bacterium]
MLTAEENDLLTRVEGDAPMGALMRRHWLPVCLTEEVAEADGTPARARILGMDLVVFRDSEGRVGVLDEQCPHRRASLAMGRNEEGGLRCLYHGWKFDVAGNALELSSEPVTSGLKDKMKHRAYPVTEWGGWVWSYFGPADSMPAFEPPPFAPNENVRVSIAKAVLPCNWAQILEGAIDSAHSSSLHSSDFVPARVKAGEANDRMWFRPSTDKSPRLAVQRTGYGFRYAALRRPIANAATHEYVRTTVFVAPITVLVPPNNLYNVANVNVPIDDTHTAFYFLAWGDPATTPSTEEWRKFLNVRPGFTLDQYYRLKTNIDERFGQDRNAMKAGNFTGIQGFPNQDIAMWITMGPITNRTDERLGASDLAVVEFRKQMVEAAQTFAAGGAAIGTGDARVPAGTCSLQAVLPKTLDWRDVRTAGDIAAAVSAA